MSELTKQQIINALPANFKNSVTQELVDTINNITQDQLVAESFRENFISYSGV